MKKLRQIQKLTNQMIKCAERMEKISGEMYSLAVEFETNKQSINKNRKSC